MPPGPLLHDRFPALRDTLPHVALGGGPTPVRRLRALDGCEAWVKEDGRYGSAYGGNKVRKLEWALADARRRGARTVLTIGALATNHGLATALYARRLGLATALVLVDQPLDEHVRAQLERLRAAGAALHVTHTTPRTVAALPWLLARHADWRALPPRLPYYLPVGGSSPVGILGYVEAGLELGEQVRAGALPEPAHAVVPVGSGGTLAGLALGLRLAGLRSRAVGVVVNDRLRLDAGRTARLAGRAAALLRRRGAALPDRAVVRPDDVLLARDWLGPGYGHATQAGTEAAALLRAADGLALDPVYAAKAMAGLLGLARRDELHGGPVLFVATGDALSGT
ncbi:MAG TPA: pyridoxal-phosphate dependent enzyme [Conexibacter sp.]|nr:pyridoxal-phosphate dependent enzyme [Conexibacter sp.]